MDCRPPHWKCYMQETTSCCCRSGLCLVALKGQVHCMTVFTPQSLAAAGKLCMGTTCTMHMYAGQPASIINPTIKLVVGSYNNPRLTVLTFHHLHFTNCDTNVMRQYTRLYVLLQFYAVVMVTCSISKANNSASVTATQKLTSVSFCILSCPQQRATGATTICIGVLLTWHSCILYFIILNIVSSGEVFARI